MIIYFSQVSPDILRCKIFLGDNSIRIWKGMKWFLSSLQSDGSSTVVGFITQALSRRFFSFNFFVGGV